VNASQTGFGAFRASRTPQSRLVLGRVTAFGRWNPTHN